MTKPIVVTGGTGFIGRAFVDALAARGEKIILLSRSSGPTRGAVERRAYTPESKGTWTDVVRGAKAVVHLAGEPVVGRWTDEKKRRIYDSRVLSTRLLAEAMASAPEGERPEVFLCGSAVGYYGPKGPDEPVDESSPPGTDFLAHVVTDWEAAAKPAVDAGVRTVFARTGIVLGKGGGALEKMIPAFKAFAGGAIGPGTQLMPWISLEDEIRMLLFALDDARVSGPLNLAAPGAVSMKELAKAVGRVLSRPALFPVPSFALRLALGEGAEALLTGQAVVPKKATDLGFTFVHRTVEEAVRAAL